MDKNEKNNLKHPKKEANCLSIISFSWLLKTFVLGYKRDLKESDLYMPLDEYKSIYLGDKIVKQWKIEEARCKALKNKKKTNLLKVLIKCFGTNFILSGLGEGFNELIVKIIQPIFLAKLLNYFSPKKNIDKSEACYWAIALVLCIVITSITSHHIMYSLVRIGLKMNVACSSLIYRKILRLSITSMDENTTVGQMVNLLSNDISRFDYAVFDIHFLWIAPIQIIIITYIMYQDVNWAALIGMFTLLLFFPIHGYFGKKTSIAVPKSAYRTDDRLRLMNEIIRGIQVIKMYAWEKPFSSLVEKSRKKEARAIKMVNILCHLSYSFEMYATRLCLFTSIAAYVYFGNSITVEKVYMMMSFYNVLRHSVFIAFPTALQSVVGAVVSARRLEKFMMLEELPVLSLNVSEASMKNPILKDTAIAFKQANAKWSLDSKTETLKDLNVIVKPGLLTAVVGQVGSGKTSLLQAILRELPLISGSLEVNGKIAYTCQESWIFASSIKQNILFGNPLNKERYEKVIEVCQLKRDLSILQYGDRTIVGDRGINLSGGQRARINLARAVYSQADIYLFDDPLSAVDAEVGRRIFEECFNTFLKGKTIVLVTHQIQYLKYVDHVIVLNEGKVFIESTFEELQNSDVNLTKHLQISSDENDQFDLCYSNCADSDPVITSTMNQDPENIEMRTYGKISHKVYLSYLKSVENWWLVVLVMVLEIMCMVTIQGYDYFVAFWVNAVESSPNNTAADAEKDWYIMWYSSISLLNVILNTVAVIIFYEMCIRASKNFHKNMFNNISRATMSFFNSNPSGRIMNRFSKDIGIVDLKLPITLTDIIEIGLSFILMLIIMITINPWLLLSSLVMIIILHFFRSVYMKTSRSIKRLEGITRSPIFDHLTATVRGLITIRAFSAQKTLAYEFDNHQDLHSTAWYIFLSSGRAFGMYIDLICSAHVTVTIFLFILLDDTALPGDVGLVITQSMLLLNMVQWGVRQSVEMENQMTSVERILEYTKLEEEPPFECSLNNKPPKQWPEKGHIEFKNVFLMYSHGGNTVLKNLNFVIMPREKIGIVGRTGAGKSSLISALFRLAYMRGDIYIDGISISSIGIHDLRTKISIIPQEPVLFAGSLRRNLDPFDEYSDHILWQALEDVEMKRFVDCLVAGLHTKISEGGSNFSTGQRQLLCLARTIIKKNKILILDEATASVDLQTDELIQKTVKKKFDDCTVLTIAHRLNTIMDCSKVLVMDGGQVVEFNHPYILLQKKSGYFYDLVQQTGHAMAQTLTSISEKVYYKKDV